MSRLLDSVVAHKVFIHANFAGLAGTAWQGWLTRGRCALVLNQLEVEAADNNSASHKIVTSFLFSSRFLCIFQKLKS